MEHALEHTLDVEDVVALEQAIAAAGTSLLELMDNAGAALARAVAQRAPKTVTVLAGSGNNGGDGWVAAGLLAARGVEATVVSPRPPDELTAEPARTAALKTLARARAPHVLVDPDLDRLAALLAGADVAVDALLGTGFSHDALRAPYAAWVELLNRARDEHGVHVVACDVPSGLSAQTGHAATPHVRADETVTMLVAKPGLFTPEGRDACGDVQVAELCDLAPHEPFLRAHAR